eukprot:TRINITY_DN1483_c0_g1_i10.p1 TRINITY_DN1483_c0_g1~~TRINITY_DN1483_c0_g1_i10.p1  ORF type:complete len:488 (+),score=106.73 TRINITY_DN1483_c0_g1_i10:82-1545(+)
MMIIYFLLLPVVALIAIVLRIHFARKAQRAGFPVPKDIEHKFFLGLTSELIGKGKDGSIYEWVAKTSDALGWKSWAWSNVAMTQVVLLDPEDVKHAFHKNFNNYTHDIRKERFQDILGDGIFNSDGAIWKQQRTMASHMFTKAQLDYMETVFVRNAGKVCSLLGTHADEKTVCDIQRFMYCYTFDSINEIAFGRAVDSLGGNEKDLSFQKSFDQSQILAATRIMNPFWKFCRFIGTKTEIELSSHLKIIDDYLHEVIDEKMKDRESNEQNLVAMHITQCEIDGNTYTASDLRDIILNFTIAGRDTTASASTSMILELLRNPDCMDRVLSEIKEANHINDMHYLKAVFQETIRLNPPVSFDSKTTTNEDVLPSGIVIRPGVQLGFHPIAFTRNPKLYPEPLKFKPSRWMNEDGTCKTYDPFVFPQFNMGPRICLGRHMAAIEAMVVVSSILSEFKLKLAPKQTFTRHYSPVPPLRSGLQVEVERLVKE